MNKNKKSAPVVKVPVLMQMEALECGAVSLAMILAYYGKWLPIEKIREDCGVSRDGSNAKNIMKAARSYGLKAEAYKLEPEELKAVHKVPCIIHWNLNHFVVFRGFKGGKAYLNDPAYGDYSVSMKEFDKSFTGICIFMEPDEGFAADGHKKSIIGFSRKRLKRSNSEIAAIIGISVVLLLAGILAPQLSENFIDWCLDFSLQANFIMFLFAFFIMSAVTVISEWMKAYFLLKIDGKMAVVGNSSYIWKVLHLPMSFFSQRLAGDIQLRQSENGKVSSMLIQTVAPVILNTIVMLFYLILMLKYSILLSCIGIVSVLINGAITLAVSRARINYSRVQIMEQGKMYSTAATGIDMIETLKASSAEHAWVDKWSNSLIAVNNSEMKLKRLNIYFGSIPMLVTSLTNAFVICLGSVLIMNGAITMGMLMAFQGFLSQFFSPVNQLVSTAQTIQEMRTQMERIDDVMEYEDDQAMSFGDDKKSDEYSGNINKLKGNITVRGLTFGYARMKPPVISDIRFEVKQGQTLAIVGASGCGKSSVAKLIAGLYKPWSGEILIDGKSISEIPRSIFTGSVAVVDQDITLFEGTISENIKLWDNTIEDFEMLLAAKDASIHDVILSREGGFDGNVSVRGENLSGGQRQCIEIARALAQDPTMIILDEATSALDAKTEHHVVSAVKRRGVTCIIIAHRLSTIRDCDEIIVLNNGKIAERGTHDELIALDGYYKQLVANE